MVKWLAAGVAGLFALSASAASAATTSCSTVAACIFGSNSSSGIGVQGSSKSGSGISGVSTSSHGVNGTSSSSFGVVGITTENATSTGTARAGVLGEDQSTNKSAYNIGVAGTSAYGYGVKGTGGTGGIFTGSRYGVLAYTTGAFAGAFPVYQSYNPNAAVIGIGLDNPSASILEDSFEGYGCDTTYVDPPKLICHETSVIDALGYADLQGLVTNSGTYVRTKSLSGPDLASYGARSATPTIEDFGTATLRNGVASVVLDRAFASTISSSYMVFVTPHGDSNSLYTSDLRTTGFVVRESKGGHSSLTFDYRIVARPIDSKSDHLPTMSSLAKARHWTRAY